MTPKMTKTIVWSVIGVGALIASYFAYQHLTKDETKSQATTVGETKSQVEGGGCPTPTFPHPTNNNLHSCKQWIWNAQTCSWEGKDCVLAGIYKVGNLKGLTKQNKEHANIPTS